MPIYYNYGNILYANILSNYLDFLVVWGRDQTSKSTAKPTIAHPKSLCTVHIHRYICT